MKKLLLFLGIMVSVLSVNAEDNVLQSIEIVPVKDTYNIVLTADKSVDVKKTVQAPNKITLEMKGIRASKTLNTVYNNVSNVDTVMVEPSGNGINLFFQAENASEACVSFDSIAVPVAAASAIKPAKKVKLNSPIDSYAPIYREETTQGKTSHLFNKLTEKSNTFKSELMDSAEDTASSLNKYISYGLIGVLAFSVIKLFRRREPEMKIGLSQNMNEREIEMYRGSQPIGTSYTNIDKPFTTVNYGINAYKKENQNPYEQETMQFHNPRLRNYGRTSGVGLNQGIANDLRTNYETVANQVKTSVMTKPVKQTPIQQQIRKTEMTDINTNTQTNPNVDNLKFLESMTAIYEKSGRHDLAQGLKASLSKNVKY